MHLDLVPALNRSELLSEEQVDKQINLEKKFEHESVQKFLDYANDWWTDYKSIRHTHKTRLVKIFAETDDREASVFTLLAPMMADRLIESPLHAARFVSLIPFQRLESPGAERVEVWHSMQAFLARVSMLSAKNAGLW
jgi:centrosomal protein CEP76